MAVFFGSNPTYYLAELSAEVAYGDQTVVVHYRNSVTVCQGGQPASLMVLNALTRGASVSVFGPVRRNGQNMEIDTARIFVAGRPRPNPAPALPNAQPTQPSTIGQLPTQPVRSNPEPAPTAQPTQPTTTGQHPVPNSVIFGGGTGGGTHAETMQRRHVVRRAGVGCFTRASASERMAEFSKPGSPRYVADPGKR